ncbi:hypothetical protein ACP70R_001772 [Stipagrostis hirtigluma subsp. patula]
MVMTTLQPPQHIALRGAAATPSVHRQTTAAHRVQRHRPRLIIPRSVVKFMRMMKGIAAQ